ncbi:uncharacterized protein LOC114517161 [Dendronephthya gigantea]|uniref:uncharacterized protein LOC114517161 n=1 Tax=Dendronephthya gigantea TaxID=151771 RepID=UPI00106B6DAC|nr:uncharacterized protein LOC114517161 [Dendronephthya gigantea]
MAARRSAMLSTSQRPKRFKAAKISVLSVSTSGKKSRKSFSLKVRKNTISDRSVDRQYGQGELDSAVDNINQGTFEQEIFDESDQEGPVTSQHNKRRFKEFSSWGNIREELLNGRIETEAEGFFNSSQKCCECGQNQVDVRCNECGIEQYFCLLCAENIHGRRNYFHVLEKLQDENIVPFFVNHVVIGREHQQNCPSAQPRNVVCIDQFGRQHHKQILFCDCEKDAVTLMKMKLWPGSATRPTLAFHVQLMELARTLLLECHVSLKKFCDALGIFSKKSTLPKWVNNIYSTLNTDSFDEYRYHQYLLGAGFPIREQTITKHSCPLCPKEGESGILIESMDACFGLVRKKSAAKCILPPRHQLTMFANQTDVDEFVENYTSNAKKADTSCNEFKAGEVNSMLRSKGKNRLYDEKGVFGRVCRHDYPKGFINIKHGERIAYSVHELERVIRTSDENCKIRMTYDIACTLVAHLKKNSRQDILDRIGFAIPIFHCYGHKSSCQVIYLFFNH